MTRDELIIALLSHKGWGPKKVYSYLEKHCFDFEECINGLDLEFDEVELEELKKEAILANKTIANNNAKGIKVISLFDDLFPKKLYEGRDKCLLLYYIGNITLLNTPSIAIIGTRKISDKFSQKGEIATKYFSKKGYTVVSGLAIGSDTVAHKTCIDNNGYTIAVLPFSCDNIQPVSNKGLASAIVEKGGLLISEYSTGTQFNKRNYAQRDIIQSLLSSVVLVIQAQNDSGTTIAMKKSREDKKTVYAIKGNNLLLADEYIDVDCEADLKKIESKIV